MAAESNSGFHYEGAFGSAMSRHAISFQSGAINSTSEMIPMNSYYGVDTTGMMFTGDSSMMSSNPTLTQAGSSSGSLLLDTVPGLKHDTGLAVEWSVEEQYKLEEGLVKFADEPSIMRYIKIAATLGDKTVRDVALRCRWMTRKRRKHGEPSFVKKMKDKKEKSVESAPGINISSASPSTMAPYPSLMNPLDQNAHMHFQALCGPTRHLLDQNEQALHQISANISTLKLQENIDLFCRARNNIVAVLNGMSEMPGIMSRMPPLPVSINEDAANSILPSTSQGVMFGGSSSGFHLKQEPGGC